MARSGARTRSSCPTGSPRARPHSGSRSIPRALLRRWCSADESTTVGIGTRSGSNRWGDYSATLVDPVNDLDFWTIQEYAATPPSNRTGAFGTWWAQVTAPSSGLNCAFTLAPVSASFNNSGGGGALTVNTTAGCLWQAASNASWIAVTTGNPGNG